MKVRELIEHLSELDPDLKVYAAIDDEGNGYNPVNFAPSVFYTHEDEIEEYQLYGVYTAEDLNAEIETGYIDEEDRERYRKIVVI